MSRHQQPGSSASPSAENTISYDQLEPGTGFPTGQLSGRLKLLFAPKPEQPSLDFAIKVKLPSSSDYAHSKRRTIMARFVLLPLPSDTEFETTRARDYERLRRALGATLRVDLRGAKVATRRTMGDGTTEVLFRASGPRGVRIDGVQYDFLKCEPPKPARPRKDWFSPSPAPAPPPRSTTTAQTVQELTRGDVTRLRPISAVPSFTLSSGRRFSMPGPGPAPAPPGPAAPVRTQMGAMCVDTSTTEAKNTPDAVRDPRVPPETVDLSSHASVAPAHAASPPPTRALLPTPSLSSRPETIHSPPSSMDGQPDPARTRAEGWSPGTRPKMSEKDNLSDKPVPASEAIEERSAQLAEREPGRAESGERRAEAAAGMPRRPVEGPSVAHTSSVQGQSPPPDGAVEQFLREKRPREESPGALEVEQKKARIGPIDEERRHVLPRRQDTQAEAEANALRMRQAQLREAEEAAARRRADVETLHRGLQVQQVQGRSIPRTYMTLREAASRSSANVAAVIVDVKGMRTTPTGDRSLTVVIADPSSHTQGNASEDMVVTLFRKTEAPLQLLAVGMPILFRALKIMTYNNKAKGQMFSNGACVLYALREGEPITTDTSGEGLSPPEVERLEALQQWWADQGEARAPTVSGENRGRQDVELGAVKEAQYFQLTGKILDMQLNTRGGNFPKYELYVADGTVSADDVRDFHGVGSRYPWLPRGSIFTLAVQNDPAGPAFAPGQIVRFPNVRVKRYAGQLELIWSDKVTLQQERDGWKSRRHQVLPSSDERAAVIEKRLKDWKKGRVPEGQEDPRHTYVPEPEVKPDPEPERVIATHLKTVHQDPILHQPSTSLMAVRENLTVPNRYRILVRVRDLIGRGARGSRPDDLAVVWCRKCSRAFAESHCRSCEDTGYKHAELRWQFVAMLEDEVGGELVVVISGPQANAILPSLPNLSHETATGLAKLRAQGIPSLRPKVENVLQGAMFDGRRTRPLIDMTLESYTKDVQGEEVVVWRVFGMETA